MSNKTLREKILAAEDRKPIPTEIPEWGISAFIRPLDGEARFRIGQLATAPDAKTKNIHIAEAYVCEGLVDEKGDPVFSIDDRVLLAKKDPQVIERLYEKVVKASGMSSGAQEDAEKK